MTRPLALEWTDYNRDRELSKAPVVYRLELIVRRSSQKWEQWTWALGVVDASLVLAAGDCGEIKSRDAAKVHAERCAREYFEGLARKLLAQ